MIIAFYNPRYSAITNQRGEFFLNTDSLGLNWELEELEDTGISEADGNRLTQEEINMIHEKENDIIHNAKGIYCILIGMQLVRLY